MPHKQPSESAPAQGESFPVTEQSSSGFITDSQQYYVVFVCILSLMNFLFISYVSSSPFLDG